MKRPSYIRQKSPVLLLAGLGGLFTVVNLGVVTTLAGLAGSVGGMDGKGSPARFDLPISVTADGVGKVFGALSAAALPTENGEHEKKS